MTSFRATAFRVLLLLVGFPAVLFAGEPPTLRLVERGKLLAAPALPEILAACEEATVEVDDPYYGGKRRFRACPLRQVLAMGFGDLEGLRGGTLLLRALDGYTRSASADQLLGPGPHLAFADADRLARGEQGFDPIDRRQVDPAPFYLVWLGPDQSDVHVHPWPYQLGTIELARFQDVYPNTQPVGAVPGSAADRGYAVFQRECTHCHAINGEGGKVGPDLNVPQSIVDYRPEAQIRAYIRDPRAFRYTSMPAHGHLKKAELDELVAYLRHMSAHKVDPGPGAGH